MNETLTASFFESGAMPVLTKSKDTTALGQEGPTSTQWSLAGFATVGFSPATMTERIYNPITAMGFSAMFTFQLDNTKS